MNNKTKYSSNALVVFSNNADLKCLGILKEGFRHCFVMLPQNNEQTIWLSCDPLSNHMEVSTHHIEREFDLIAWLRAQGCKTILAPINHSHKKCAPPMFFTCVEAVKRILGIHNITIFTPWQLYRYLAKQHQSHHKEGV